MSRLCAFAVVAVAYNNGVDPHPALGWNSWCTQSLCGQGGVSPGQDPLHDVCNETEIRSIAEAMLSNGMHELGYNRINLDDCWVAENRTADGILQPDKARFPNGMKEMIEWIHSKGLLFGLYTSAGTTTCNNKGRTWPGLKNGTWPRHGSFGHYKEDTALFAEWGVDYVKIDYCGSMEGHHSDELHTNFSHWLNETGRSIWLELCRGYPHPLPDYVKEVANSWRVAGDNWDYWPHTINTIQDFINQSHLAGPYNWNYGDFLMTGGAGCGKFHEGDHCPGQSEAEYRTQFAVYVIAASPLIVGTDIRNMTPVMKDLLLNKEMVAVNQDYLAKAGDLYGRYACSGAGTCELTPVVPGAPKQPQQPQQPQQRASAGACEVSLVTQLSSNHKCVFNETFGCYAGNKTMYTREGCRGVFECDGKKVECDHMGDSDNTHVCKCDGSGPKPGPHPKPSPQPSTHPSMLLWARHLSDGSVALALTNLDDDAHTDVSIPFSAFGWDDLAVAAARDLWAHKDVPGSFVGSLNATVDAHDTLVFKLTKSN